MPTLNATQVYRLAREAGFNATEAAFATQIAWVESGFKTDAHGTGPRDDSYGLWQINTLGNNWANVKNNIGAPCQVASKQSLWDPKVNACVAYQMYKSVGFDQPWKGSVDKAKTIQFDKPLSDALLANTRGPGVGQGGGGGSSGSFGNSGLVEDVVVNVVGAANAAGDFVGGIADALTPDWMEGLARLLGNLLDPDWWRRIGIAVLGVAIVLGGLVFMFMKSDSGKSVVKTATMGKVAK